MIRKMHKMTLRVRNISLMMNTQRSLDSPEVNAMGNLNSPVVKTPLLQASALV
jgi:hypothetical protein